MATRRPPGKTIFFPPKNQRLADIVSIESPAAFRRSIKVLAADGLDAREKRALVLAQNRARAMLRRRTLSPKERREFEEIARIPLPPVGRRASAASSRRGRTASRGRATARTSRDRRRRRRRPRAATVERSGCRPD
jgi:hypothetical protein